VPVAFGVLTVDNVAQAEARIEKAADAVRSALEMADLFAGCAQVLAKLPPAMSKICAYCGKKPAFGNNRSHSMVATKRRFDPNLQRVRVLLDARPACLCVYPLPEVGQGHQSV